MLVGESKGGRRATEEGETVYRKAERGFREVSIASKARSLKVQWG